MLLIPGGLGRERLLGYGNEGAGKTFGVFTILERVAGHCYYLDTDDTVIPFLDGDRFGPLQDRITFENPEEFGEGLDYVERWRDEAGKEDWLVIDRMDWAWDAAQSEFSDKVFGTEIDDHLMNHRLAVQNARTEAERKAVGNPFEGFTDWTVIKKRHQRLMKAVLKFPGHVYLTASEKKVDDKLDDANAVRTYGRVGAKPGGEKNNGYAVRSVIRFQGNNPATWRLTTVKDRERPQLQESKVTDFALDYLVKVARWKPVAGG